MGKKTKKIQMYKCIDNVKVYDLLENKVHKKTIINATISVLPQTINIIMLFTTWEVHIGKNCA